MYAQRILYTSEDLFHACTCMQKSMQAIIYTFVHIHTHMLTHTAHTQSFFRSCDPALFKFVRRSLHVNQVALNCAYKYSLYYCTVLWQLLIRDLPPLQKPAAITSHLKTQSLYRLPKLTGLDLNPDPYLKTS